MADGSRKPISQIRVGDIVLATDPDTGDQTARKVTHVWVHEDRISRLTVDGDSVATTGDHPFWNATAQSWEPAAGLKTGDELLAADGRYARVTGLEAPTSARSAAYNLTVDGGHTYHVGRLGLLVHNTCAITSMISDDALLVREAGRASKSVQSDLDRLTAQLGKGNLNPGIGSRSLGGGVHEA
jgi:hypothetical protein